MLKEVHDDTSFLLLSLLPKILCRLVVVEQVAVFVVRLAAALGAVFVLELVVSAYYSYAAMR